MSPSVYPTGISSLVALRQLATKSWEKQEEEGIKKIKRKYKRKEKKKKEKG